jgi:hypothetical protein
MFDAAHTAATYIRTLLEGYTPNGQPLEAFGEWRDNETRPLLAGVARLAEQYACVVLSVQHLRKSPKDHAIYRGLGSIDLAASARSILLAGQHPETPHQRIRAHVKSNLAPHGRSLAFELRE